MKQDAAARIASLLMVSETPLAEAQLQHYAELEKAHLIHALETLQERLPAVGLQLAKVAEGWRIQVHPDQTSWVQAMRQVKAPKLSRAQLETLAIIAHRQPITRAEIEQIRGVSVSSSVLQALQSYGWVKTHGHKDVPGKPALWVTTKQLLIDLGVETLTTLQTKLKEIVQQAQLNIDHEN